MKTSIRILLAVFGAILVLLLAMTVFYITVTAGVKLDPQKLAETRSCTRIFDAAGDELEPQAGESVALSDLPDYLPNAFVAVEDKRFYSHGGIDPKRMVKAALKNLASFSFREGASTITQQLIKNTHLSGEKTLSRKLREIKLARALERACTKEEILGYYLNSIYFGHSAFGIADAARFYFGKAAETLTPAEGATLAALVRSPNRYSPFKDAEACRNRRNFVLSLMAEQGYLTAEEAETAKAEPLPAAPHERGKASPYLALVYEELAELFPKTSGLRVYTYLDRPLQAALETIEADSDVCALVRDNNTNAVKAFFSTCGILRRLPASTIKPLAVYGPALQENLISPATPLLDEKTDFGGYSPSNYGGSYGGYMSARYALSRSVNVPAVKLLNALGVGKAAEYLGEMDLRVDDADKTLALALGGMKEGYTLPALADGYSVFARGGLFRPARTIRKIEDCQGKLLYSDEKCQGKSLDRRIFSEDVCALMNDMLSTAAKEGTARKLGSLPFPVCAKTGTGGTSGGNTDAYTIGYTADDVVAVWLGNRDNSPIGATGGGLPADLALGVFKTLYQDRAPREFPCCREVTEVMLDREEYEKNHRLLRADPAAPDYLALKELFRASAIPAGISSRFSSPKIEKPLIFVKNGAVRIVLCQTQYYDYVIKRECEGKISVIYEGRYRKEIHDNSVRSGKTYTYTVVPIWQGVEGEPVVLPSVFIEPPKGLPDDWWEASKLDDFLR